MIFRPQAGLIVVLTTGWKGHHRTFARWRVLRSDAICARPPDVPSFNYREDAPLVNHLQPCSERIVRVLEDGLGDDAEAIVIPDNLPLEGSGAVKSAGQQTRAGTAIENSGKLPPAR